MKFTKNFSIEDLGIQEKEVYDIEVGNTHKFYGNGILLHNSNYISLEDVIDKLKVKFKTHKEYRDWAIKFREDTIIPLINQATKIYDEKFNSGRSINFKPEKIVDGMFITGRKHYVVDIIDDEGKDCSSEPKFKNTGIEIKKRDRPFYVRDVLEQALKMILRGSTKKEINDYMIQSRKEFENQPIENIAVRGGIKNYTKYAIPLKLTNGQLKYAFKSPARNKAAVNYNFLIKELKLMKEPEIGDGDLMCYIRVIPNNKYKFETLGFIDKWPKEFSDVVKVDYELLWQKSLIQLAERWWKILGWGSMKTEHNSFDDIFG